MPEQLYHFIGDSVDSRDTLSRVAAIRRDSFISAIEELGITKEMALQAVSMAVEEKYRSRGREVMADIRMAKRNGREEYAFAVIEFIPGSGPSAPDAVVIEKPLLPTPKEVLNSVYDVVGGASGWRSAIGKVVDVAQTKIILRIISDDDLRGAIALLPKRELAYMDDEEGIAPGNTALVAVAQTNGLRAVSKEGRTYSPELLASRAIGYFPTIVGPRLGILNSVGYAHAGLCVYEMRNHASISRQIAEAEFIASALGVERVSFIHQPASPYVDIYIRNYVRQVCGVKIATRDIAVQEHGKNLRCLIKTRYGEGRKISGKFGRNLHVLARMAGVNRIDVKEVAR
ncbi:hypothetical protein HAQ00_02365 [Acidithiobacillus caldus ATCC 51756]|nr:hypothetical protein [Acidithiobacillus caldus ATCC 51756]